MTPVPFELPLRASEAAAVADLLFQQVEGKPLTPDQRGRFAGRLSALSTPSLIAYPASLSADPIHPSTYYLAVDGLTQGVTPLLLRIGVASAPGTALFPKSLMVGRMRPGGQREIVISGIPFATTDEATIRTFVEKVDKAFLPKATGLQPSTIVHCDDAALEAQEVFRVAPRTVNLAVEVDASGFWAVLWAAIRAGRREAFSVATAIDCQAPATVEALAWFTRYRLTGTAAQVAPVMDQLRRLKAGLPAPHARTVDFELGGEDVETQWAALKTDGRPVQAAAVATLEQIEAARAAGLVPVVPGGLEVPAGTRVSTYWPSAEAFLRAAS